MYLPAPYVIQQIIDNLKDYSFTKQELYIQGGGLLLLMLISLAFTYYTAIYTIKFRRNYNANIKNKIYDTVLNADYATVNKMSETDIQARATSDVSKISYLTPIGLNNFVVETIKLILLGSILLFTNIELSVLLIIMIPVSYVVFRIVSTTLYTLSRRTHETFSDYNSKILETFLSIKECQIDASYDYHSKKIQESIDQSEDAAMNFSMTNRKVQSLMGIIPLVITVTVWCVGGSHIIDKVMSVGEIISYMIYLSMFYGPVNYVYSFMINVQIDISAIERVEQVLTLPQNSRNTGHVLQKFENTIDIEDVCFSYDLIQILKKVSFRIHKGEKICVIGKNGCGKTTLLNILLGLVKPDSGCVRVNNKDLMLCNMDSYRKLIGYVPQNIFIYRDTLINNITLGKDYPEGLFEKIIQQVGLDDLYSKAKKDSSLLINESVISGGMKQKIGIARALIKDPHLLIMDEPTNHLDENTLKQIKRVIEQNSDLSIIYISHNVALQAIANRCLVLNNGELINE